MRHGHRRRRPECQQESEIQRVAHELVGCRRRKVDTRVVPADEVEPHLSKPEQVEMVDEERHQEDLQPAVREHRPDEGARQRLVDAPNRPAKRAPLPEQQVERKAGEEHVRGTFNRPWHDLRPPALEPASRHDTVLERKYGEQTRVNTECGPERRCRGTIELRWNAESADEGNGVEKRREEQRVGDAAIDEIRDASDHRDLLISWSDDAPKRSVAPDEQCPDSLQSRLLVRDECPEPIRLEPVSQPWAGLAAWRGIKPRRSCETGSSEARSQWRPIRQTVRYVAASDGVRLACAESGAGMPLVKAATWLTHLEYDLDSPVWRHWMAIPARATSASCGTTSAAAA